MSVSAAAVLTAYRAPLELREYPVPDTGAGEALIRVEMAGVCGTDVHLCDGELGAHRQRHRCRMCVDDRPSRPRAGDHRIGRRSRHSRHGPGGTRCGGRVPPMRGVTRSRDRRARTPPAIGDRVWGSRDDFDRGFNRRRRPQGPGRRGGWPLRRGCRHRVRGSAAGSARRLGTLPRRRQVLGSWPVMPTPAK